MFFSQILTLKGSNLGQKSQFFRSLPQPWDHPFYIRFFKIYMYCKGQVPESTGSRSKNHFCRVFFNKKMPNFELFLNRSFKFKETLIVVYTHEYLWETTIKSLPELCCYLRKFSAYVNRDERVNDHLNNTLSNQLSNHLSKRLCKSPNNSLSNQQPKTA